VVHCSIEGIAPTPENLRTGQYPLARYLNFVTAAPPRGEVRRFIDWSLGPKGQQIVSRVGYIPLWAHDTGRRNGAHLLAFSLRGQVNPEDVGR
jgi:phosphate transport system substrate-binding protein